MNDETGLRPFRHTFTSAREYRQAQDEILKLARRQVFIFERGLDPHWDHAPRADILRRVCLTGSRSAVRIVLHDPESMVRNTPRLRSLLDTCAHVVTVNRTRDEALRAEDSILIVEGCHHVHRFHVDSDRGVLAINDPDGTQSLIQRFEQIWAASEPGLSGTTLGL